MTDPVSGNKIPPELQATYRNEFARGVKLFEESLAAYETRRLQTKWPKKRSLRM